MGTVHFLLKRSSRKTICIEICQDSSVLVRAPYRMPMEDIQAFVEKKEPWILKKQEEARRQQEVYEEQMRQVRRLSQEELHALAEQALSAIPQRVEYFSKIMNVTYGKITIRNQKTRWGSCSAKGNLNFNCLLMLMPEEILDYVVVHELAHRRQMNHSPAFWKIVEAVLPDYRDRRQWLKDHGNLYIEMLPGLKPV